MGNATTICSDKTGTLTKNKMTVVRSWIATHDFTFKDFAQVGVVCFGGCVVWCGWVAVGVGWVVCLGLVAACCRCRLNSIPSPLSLTHSPTQISTVISEDVRNRIAQHIAFNSSAEANYTISPKDNLPVQDGNKVGC